MPTESLPRPLLPRVIFALLLLLVIGTYWPARYRFFGGDQFSYFAELRGDRSLAAGLRLLDYNAVRTYHKGDELLFRPLFFAWMALQNTLFKLDARGWNLASLTGHLFAVWILFEALWRLHRSYAAHAIALWFGLLAVNFEQVTWNHLGAYLLGYSLLLVAVMALREALLQNKPQAWGIYAPVIGAAMLFHEIAVFTAGLAILFALRKEYPRPNPTRLRMGLALLLPLVIYFLLYFTFHVPRCERWLWTDPGAGGHHPLWLAPFLMLRIAGLWLVRILLPASFYFLLRPGGRSFWATAPNVFSRPDLYLQLGLWLIIAICLRRAWSPSRWQSEKKFVLLLGLILGAYLVMNTAGRWYASQVAYYPYFVALFGTVAVWSLLDLDRTGRGARLTALVIWLLLTGFNGHKLLHTCRQIQTLDGPLTHFVATVDREVRRQLAANPRLTFGIQNLPPKFDIHSTLGIGYPGSDKQIEAHLFRVLFGPAYSPYWPDVWVVLE